MEIKNRDFRGRTAPLFSKEAEFLLLLSFLSCSFVTQGQNGHFPLKFSHLAGDFYIFTTFKEFKGVPFPANGMYVVTNNGVLLLDTPWDSTQFQPLLDSIQMRHRQKVVLCLATHFHEDRTGGFLYYRQKGIKTFASQHTDRLCRERGEKRADFLWEKDTSFTVGQYTLQTFYPGPGHTPDNAVVWFAKEKILYGGCFVKSTEAKDLGNLQDADTKAWSASLQRVMRKFPDAYYVIPGHQDWENKSSLEHTLQLLRESRR